MAARRSTRRSRLASPSIRSRSISRRAAGRKAPAQPAVRRAAPCLRHAARLAGVSRLAARHTRPRCARRCWRAARRPTRPAAAPCCCRCWRACRSRWRCSKWAPRRGCACCLIAMATTMAIAGCRRRRPMRRCFPVVPIRRRRCLRRSRASRGGWASTSIRSTSPMHRDTRLAGDAGVARADRTGCIACAPRMDVARRDPPRVVQGDLLKDLPDHARQAPPDATLVVFHSAVLAYVADAGLARGVRA